METSMAEIASFKDTGHHERFKFMSNKLADRFYDAEIYLEMLKSEMSGDTDKKHDWIWGHKRLKEAEEWIDGMYTSLGVLNHVLETTLKIQDERYSSEGHGGGRR